MKIIYDARWVKASGVHDGISRYSTSLLWALSKLHPNLTMLIHNKEQLSQLPDIPHLLVNNPANIFREIGLPRRLNAEQPDVVWSPFYLMGAWRRKYKLILTIHDLIFFEFRTPPQWMNFFVRMGWFIFHSARWPTKFLLNSADAVATVSNTVKRQLANWEMTKRPIFAVLNGAHRKPLLETKQPHYKSRDIVYMGSFTPYKNVELLIRAMKFLPSEHLHLLSPVPPLRKMQLKILMKANHVSRRVTFYNGVSDAKYQEMLAKCRVLVTASKIEGFGLPIVEAQQQGIPVACSDTPIFHEVAGKGALYFDPYSPEECAKRLIELQNPRTSQHLIKMGLQNVEKFTWENSAKEVLKIIKEF